MSRRLEGTTRTVLAAGSAALAVFLAYYEVLTYWFTGTDTIPLIETSRVSTIEGVLGIFARPLMEGTHFTDRALFYRPVASLSYAIDYRLWGLDPFGYHLTDLLAHAAAAALIVLLVQAVLGDRLTAAIAGWIFALHPLTVEVVPTPARRHDVLATVFALGALYLFVRALKTTPWTDGTDRTSGTGEASETTGGNAAAGAIASGASDDESAFSRRRWLLVGGSVLSYLLAIGSKELGVLVPILIGAWFLLAVHAYRPSLRTAIRSGEALLAPYAIATGGYLALRVLVLGGLGGYDRPAWSSTGEALTVTVSRYVLSLLYPVDFVGALSGFQPQLIPNGLYVVLAGASVLAVHNVSRTRSATSVLASARGRLLALAGVWFVTPVWLFVRTGRYTLRSGYISIVPVAVVLAMLLLTAARNAGARRRKAKKAEDTDERVPPGGRMDESGIGAGSRSGSGSGSRPSSRPEPGPRPRARAGAGPGLATLAVALVLIVSLLAGSALVNPYDEWERAGAVSEKTLEGVSATAEGTPANATMDVEPVPHPKSARRMGSFPHAQSVTFIWGNTIASWLRLQGYAGQRDVYINGTTVLNEMPEGTSASIEQRDGRLLLTIHYAEDCPIPPAEADSAENGERARNGEVADETGDRTVPSSGPPATTGTCVDGRSTANRIRTAIGSKASVEPTKPLR
jgi:hypothetical protein